jgi:hypothetical protein
MMDTLAGSISENKCVLFLGPLFGVSDTGEKIHELIFNKLKDAYSLDAEFQNLFIVSNNNDSKKSSLKYKLDNIYQSITPNAIYTDVVTIPFCGIINCTQDPLLKDRFDTTGIPFKFSYYKHTSKDAIQKNIANEKSRYTYLYNVYGLTKDTNSLIVDYNRFYNFLMELLNDPPNLPQELISMLSSATVFLFLGFDLLQWYIPLIIRKLYKFRSNDDIIQSIAIMEDTMRSVLSTDNLSYPQSLNKHPREFEIGVSDTSQSVIDALKQHPITMPLLRKIAVNNLRQPSVEERTKLRETCTGLANSDKKPELIKELLSITRQWIVDFEEKDVNEISQRYENNEKIWNQGLKTDENHNIDDRKIALTLTELVSRI